MWVIWHEYWWHKLNWLCGTYFDGSSRLQHPCTWLFFRLCKDIQIVVNKKTTLIYTAVSLPNCLCCIALHSFNSFHSITNCQFMIDQLPTKLYKWSKMDPFFKIHSLFYEPIGLIILILIIPNMYPYLLCWQLQDIIHFNSNKIFHKKCKD